MEFSDLIELWLVERGIEVEVRRAAYSTTTARGWVRLSTEVEDLSLRWSDKRLVGTCLVCYDSESPCDADKVSLVFVDPEFWGKLEVFLKAHRGCDPGKVAPNLHQDKFYLGVGE